MPASETRLPLRLGARTLFTLRRRLCRASLTLNDALHEAVPSLPALGDDEHGHFVTALPEAQLAALQARNSELKLFIRQYYRRHYARLDQDFDTYLAGFSSKSRSTLRRKLKRLAERSGGKLDLHCYRNESEMADFHSRARTVSALTYQERLLDAGLPEGPEALAEMRRLARAGRARGWLLFLDGAPIAYLWTPAEGATLIYAYLGYDPAFAEYSPGTVLQLEAMRQLMEERAFALFDFTEGEGQHKSLFATGSVDCVDLLLLRRSAANFLVGHSLTGFDGAVALAKRATNMLGLANAARRLRRAA